MGNFKTVVVAIVLAIALVVASLLPAFRPPARAATTISASQLTVSLVGSLANTLALTQGSLPITYAKVLNFANGSGNGQFTSAFLDERTLAASANEDLTINGGSLKDGFGNTLAFALVKAAIIYALPANTNNVVIAPGASNGFTGPFGGTTPTQTIQPGGMYLVTAPNAGYTVDGTHKVVNILNGGSGTSVTYDVIFLGA